MPTLKLKPGRERSLLRRHPWVFSGALEEVHGSPEPGETVDIIGHSGQWLARAAFSPHSQIRARIWTWQEGQAVTPEFVARRIREAIGRRANLAHSQDLDAYREVYAESDGVPGLIVDRYAGYRVAQFLTAGAERWRDVIVEVLSAADGLEGLLERSQAEARGLEGLQPRSGQLWGRSPGENLLIHEWDLRFNVDLVGGQKTGFYLDQRQNRRAVRRLISGGEVLDCFCYTGGFTVSALLAGAEKVISIDSSAGALERAKQNLVLNGLDPARCALIEANVFEELRRFRDRGRTFDAIVLDPPRFAASSAQRQRAARGYKDINLLAFKMLRPGGLLFSYSCSGAVGPELFQSILAGAALDAGIEAQVIETSDQPEDHPVALNFPESRYLKGLVCRVHNCA